MRCANPSCSCESLYLRSGGLYWINPARNDNQTSRKIIWLCRECSKHFVVETWRPPGEQIHLRDSCDTRAKQKYRMAG